MQLRSERSEQIHGRNGIHLIVSYHSSEKTVHYLAHSAKVFVWQLLSIPVLGVSLSLAIARILCHLESQFPRFPENPWVYHIPPSL